MNNFTPDLKSPSSILELAEGHRIDISRRLAPKKRSEMGQFMTPAPIARFMAFLFDSVKHDQIRLLDAGAGIGSLSAAFIEEFCSRETTPEEIHVIAYELDQEIIGYLQSTLINCQALCQSDGIKLSSEIKFQDFIEEGARKLTNDLFIDSSFKEFFTHVIMNPPYKKIRSNSAHRKWLRSIGVETSNLYTGFLAVAIKMLGPGGELVAIVPRSFCNGPYFKSFRNLLLDQMAIKRFHVFESRTHAFKDDEVLQENIIFHAVKSCSHGTVRITSSRGAEFIRESEEVVAEDMTQRDVPYASIVKPNDPEKFIHIATTDLEQYVADRISVFNRSLEDLDIEVSTGPVVDFRLKDICAKIPKQEPLLCCILAILRVVN